MIFPNVTGRSLGGVDIALPHELPATRTLCLVAFRQWHQPCVDRWITAVEAAGVPGSPMDLTSADEACVLEIPVIGTQWRLGRRFIDGGMATSIRIPRVLARTITVYTDVGAFQRALAIPGSDDVQALVVTRQGDILARAAGEPTDEALGVVVRALDITQRG
jgi:hypothetical protein